MRAAARIAAVVALAGCGPGGPIKHPIDPTKPVERVVMEPIVIKAWKEGETIKSEAYDASLLFDEAFALFEQGEYEKSRALYTRVLDEFPGSSLEPAATFNLALCQEKLGLVAEAVAIYEQLIQAGPGSDVVLDAMFRLGYCLEGLGRWLDAIAVYREILEIGDLSGPDVVEAMCRIGCAEFASGDIDRAEEDLRLVVQYFLVESQIERFENTFYVALAQFTLGEIYRRRFEAVVFTTDEAEIREALEKKLAHMVEARDAYVQTIKLGNYHWAAAAGFAVGQLFRTLYDDVMEAPLPPEIDTQELVDTYYEMLAEQVRPLLESAVSVWEKTLLMAERVGLEGQWVEATDQALAETRALIASEMLGEEPNATP